MCNKPVVVYYNLDQNMGNRRLPATGETKTDHVVFRKYFREYFYSIREIQKISSRFSEVYYAGYLRNVNKSRNRVFLFYLTLFQIVLLLCIIPNSIKIEPTVFSVL